MECYQVFNHLFIIAQILKGALEVMGRNGVFLPPNQHLWPDLICCLATANANTVCYYHYYHYYYY